MVRKNKEKRYEIDQFYTCKLFNWNYHILQKYRLQIHGRKWKTKHSNKITFQQLDSRGDIETSEEQSDFLEHKYDKLLHCYLSKVVNADSSSSLKKSEMK